MPRVNEGTALDGKIRYWVDTSGGGANTVVNSMTIQNDATTAITFIVHLTDGTTRTAVAPPGQTMTVTFDPPFLFGLYQGYSVMGI